MSDESSPLSANRRGGKVIALPADPKKVTITIGGDDTTTYDAPFHESYWPIVGDDVVVLSNQGTHYVLGTSYGPPGHAEFITNAPSSYTSVSTTFSLVPNTTSPTLSKRRDGTRLKVDLRISAFAGTSFVRPEWGLQELPAGINHMVVGMTINLTAHTTICGIGYFTGLLAGDYTFKVIGRRASGAGTLTMDVDDYIHYTIDECP